MKDTLSCREASALIRSGVCFGLNYVVTTSNQEILQTTQIKITQNRFLKMVILYDF